MALWVLIKEVKGSFSSFRVIPIEEAKKLFKNFYLDLKANKWYRGSEENANFNTYTRRDWEINEIGYEIGVIEGETLSSGIMSVIDSDNRVHMERALRYCHGIARGEYSLLVQKILGVDALAEVVSCIEFKLTPKLPIEKASSGRTIGQFDREYPNMNDICRVCGKRFGQHHGFECLEDKS